MNGSLDRTVPDAWPETDFAPAERADDRQLRREIEAASCSPITDALLRSFGGFMAVLNGHRQILAVNRTFLDDLGIPDAGGILGLRPGEALGCDHATDHPGGCGTSRACSTCGAVLAVVAALESGRSGERSCAMSAHREGREISIEFSVRAVPIVVEGHSLVAVFMRDVSEDSRRATLQRTFFHDVGNILSGLCAASQILATAPGRMPPDTAESIHDLAVLLERELEIHRALMTSRPGTIRIEPKRTTTGEILHKVEAIFATHPAAIGQMLDTEAPDGDLDLETDRSILLRVLTNLVTNAFESGQPGDVVQLRVRRAEGAGAIFEVWNREMIPEEVALRVFQRYFSTKGGSGRGLGTFAVRWLTEEFLGGVVSFESSPVRGTTFRVRLP